MRAIDTNVVVRFLTNDDKPQAEAARKVIEGGEIFVATSVLLEAEWVLRSAYGFESAAISNSFLALAGLPTILVEEPARLARALDWSRRGMDFADALHLAKADGCAVFLSFDQKLARLAKTIDATPVEQP